MAYVKLNYPPIHLRARRGANGRTEIFDAVRGRWLVLTPEEWVRRHVVGYLISECGFCTQQIVEEYPVNINGMAQRADIVAYNNDAEPYLIIECKEPNIKIDDDVLRQVVRYNSVVEARYIVLTNGIDTYSWQYNGNDYVPIAHFPHLE